jgi:hypothetical protein
VSCQFHHAGKTLYSDIILEITPFAICFYGFTLSSNYLLVAYMTDNQAYPHQRNMAGYLKESTIL